MGGRKLMEANAQQSSSNNSERWLKSYCPYCGVGCGLLAGMRDGAVVKIKGDTDHPVQPGRSLSQSGLPAGNPAHSGPFALSADSLLPGGPFKRASWDQTMTYLAKRFRDIIDEHGPDAVAFYGSGQLTTEEYYIANKLAKGFIGTNNFDTNSRLCMASAVAGYKSFVWRGRSAQLLRGHRRGQLHFPDRHQHRGLPSGDL